MKRISTFFKKYALLIFLGFLAAVVVGLRLVYRPASPVSAPGPTPSPAVAPYLPYPSLDGQPILAPITLSGQEKWNIPEKLAIWQGEPNFITPEETRKIAGVLGFTGEPKTYRDAADQTHYTWAQNADYLSINLHLSEIVFTRDPFQSPLPATGTLPSREESEEQLADLLKELDLGAELNFSGSEPVYLAYFGPSLDPVSANKAEVIKTGLNPLLGDYRVLGRAPHASLVYLLLDRQNNRIGFEYRFPFRSFTENSVPLLRSATEIETDLTREGKIVSIDQVAEGDAGVELESISLDQLEIIYLFDSESVLLQPVFLLTGTGKLARGGETALAVYLPAVKSEALKTPPGEHFEVKSPTNPLGLKE